MTTEENNNTNSANNLLINLLNLQDNLSEECMICKDELSCYPCYKLPECNHEYHTHCLIAWFRNGDSRCPYCGNKGINNKSDNNNTRHTGFRRSRFYCTGTYEATYIKDLRKFAHSKKNEKDINAIKLRKEFDKIKILEVSLKENNTNFSEFKKSLKNTDVNYCEAKKKMSNYRHIRWRIVKSINCEKFKLVNNSYMIPLIIPTPADLN
tara:strand:- start:2351 stop:2977 length:627 start_codon:yes stop_codon:yes gene_type:complete